MISETELFLRDSRLKERLLRESSDLTTDEAGSICRAGEASKTKKKRNWKILTRAFQFIGSETVQLNAFKTATCGTEHQPKSCPAFGRLCLVYKLKERMASLKYVHKWNLAYTQTLRAIKAPLVVSSPKVSEIMGINNYLSEQWFVHRQSKARLGLRVYVSAKHWSNSNWIRSRSEGTPT